MSDNGVAGGYTLVRRRSALVIYSRSDHAMASRLKGELVESLWRIRADSAPRDFCASYIPSKAVYTELYAQPGSVSAMQHRYVPRALARSPRQAAMINFAENAVWLRVCGRAFLYYMCVRRGLRIIYLYPSKPAVCRIFTADCPVKRLCSSNILQRGRRAQTLASARSLASA